MVVEISGKLGHLVETVPLAEAPARIDELSGRSIGRYVLDQARRQRGRAYVATHSASPWTEQQGSRGFIITIVR